VSNAIRYTPSGGPVEIQFCGRRATVVIAVRDTGIGISSEHPEKIFGRLYRVDKARDRAAGGLEQGCPSPAAQRSRWAPVSKSPASRSTEASSA
jgi:signal transduction histidine kinase